MKKNHTIREATDSLRQQINEWVKATPKGYLKHLKIYREQAPEWLSKSEKKEYEEKFYQVSNGDTLFYGDLEWLQANRVQDIINEVIRQVNNYREEKDLV